MATDKLATLNEAIHACLQALGATPTADTAGRNDSEKRYEGQGRHVESLAKLEISTSGDGEKLRLLASQISESHARAGVDVAPSHPATEPFANAANGATIQVLVNEIELCNFESGTILTNCYNALTSQSFDPTDKVELLAVLKKRDFLSAIGADRNQHCFVGGAALHTFLEGPLPQLATLWPARGVSARPNRKRALIHTLTEDSFDGHLLRVGSNISAERTSPSVVRLAGRYQLHQASIAHSNVDLAGITPAHLARRNATANEPAGIHRHQSLLTLAHLCDIARQTDDKVTVEYRSGNLNASIELAHQPPAQYPGELVGLCDWVYQPIAEIGAIDTFFDRLAVAQTVLARDLQPVPADRRLEFVTDNDRQFLDDTRQAWKSYVGDKIDAHLAKTIELESEISDAVAEFGTRTDDLVSDLTKAMAGAVAAVITSFLSAAFSDKFNTEIFQIGLGTYLAYLVIFPGIIGLSVYRSRQTASEAEISTRIKTYEGPLGRQKVKDINGNRLDSASHRFSNAFGGAILVYIVVTILGVFAMQTVPDIVTESDCNTTSSQQQACP